LSKTQKPGAGRRRAILTIVLFVMAAAMFTAAGMMARRVLVQTHTTAMQAISPPFDGRKQFRILVLGEDNPGTKRADVHGRSDTILVAAIDLNHNVVRAVSIPRDTRCMISGSDHYVKVNAAYARGGAELSKQTAEQLLGVQIDYYMKTNIEGLKRTVDILGGVEIDIEKDMHYTDRHGGLYINLRKGYRHLNGDQALQYVRFRHDALGDITRIQRQQKFLRAVARRMMAPENVTKLTTVIGEIMSNVETNMSGKDLVALARLSKQIQPETLQMEMLPAVPQRIGKVSYMILDTAGAQAMVDRLLKFQLPPPPKPTVEVLNGTGMPGVAAKVSKMLTDAGYKVQSTGNAPNFNYEQSEIQAHTKDMQGAIGVGTVVNCTNVHEAPTKAGAKADVTVIVGKDTNL
jgi:polyisoprenyl-teichoic acid--peptidoglycan teichoic acid transferase